MRNEKANCAIETEKINTAFPVSLNTAFILKKNDKWVPPVILKESDFRFLISYYASDKLIIVSLPEKL